MPTSPPHHLQHDIATQLPTRKRFDIVTTSQAEEVFPRIARVFSSALSGLIAIPT